MSRLQMGRVVVAAGLVVGLVSLALAQQLPASPFKGSNIIWAVTAAPADSVLSQLQQHLHQRGFVLIRWTVTGAC